MLTAPCVLLEQNILAYALLSHVPLFMWLFVCVCCSWGVDLRSCFSFLCMRVCLCVYWRVEADDEEVSSSDDALFCVLSLPLSVLFTVFVYITTLTKWDSYMHNRLKLDSITQYTIRKGTTHVKLHNCDKLYCMYLDICREPK